MNKLEKIGCVVFGIWIVLTSIGLFLIGIGAVQMTPELWLKIIKAVLVIIGFISISVHFWLKEMQRELNQDKDEDEE